MTINKINIALKLNFLNISKHVAFFLKLEKPKTTIMSSDLDNHSFTRSSSLGDTLDVTLAIKLLNVIKMFSELFKTDLYLYEDVTSGVKLVYFGMRI